MYFADTYFRQDVIIIKIITEEYKTLANNLTPNSNNHKIIFKAFVSDGFICTFAQILALIFEYLDSQDVNSDGSGASCSASVVCSNIFKRIEEGEIKRVLFAGTGAFLSSLSPLQGETIPSIAHAILFERED